jgi:hypothetical protein
MTVRDSQRSKVYAWERVFETAETLSLDECRNLVMDVWAAYRPRQRPPRIADGRGTRSAYGSSSQISLPIWSRKKLFVLHEITHSLNPAGAFHSPEFVALLIELLVRWAGLERSALRKEARKRRVKVAPWTAIEKPSARTRAATRLDRPRACEHNWSTKRVKSSKVTREGLAVVYAARCDICGKEIG